VDAWSAGNTVLTCTPQSPFMANTTVTWTVDGESAGGDPMIFPATGTFSTGTGGSSGSGTNATTTFSVGKVHHYLQSSSAAPTLDPVMPYGFSGVTMLASNRTASSVTLTLPTGAVSNLTQLPPPSAGIFLLSTVTANLAGFDATFPAGNYSFFVQAPASNQTVIVNLPTTGTLPQPAVPRVTNYVAAQTVNPNQPFVLAWDAWSGGSATDHINVDIGDDFGSPDPGQPGALTGTAVGFVIPAGTLQPNTVYSSAIGFFRQVGSTNASYSTAAYRATYTEFTLQTGSGTTGALTLTNASYASGSFRFDVVCTAGQNVTVEYKTNLSSIAWQLLFNTNSPGTRFRAVAPQAATNRLMFFRARSGP
jgi:hypothetical protein